MIRISVGIGIISIVLMASGCLPRGLAVRQAIRAQFERRLAQDSGHSQAAPPQSGSYTSGGKTIAYERFTPALPGKRPALLLVHGADGLQNALLADGYRRYAQNLARAGYDVFLIHYFDRTNTKESNRELDARNFVPWFQTLTDGISYVSQQPNIDSQHIGLLGFSLGAALSIALAAHDPRVGALVEYFGGLPDWMENRIQRMPPTLILHGDHDPLVSVQYAYKLQAVLQKKHLPVEMKVYPGQGHGFVGDARADSARRTQAFFDRYLQP